MHGKILDSAISRHNILGTQIRPDSAISRHTMLGTQIRSYSAISRHNMLGTQIRPHSAISRHNMLGTQICIDMGVRPLLSQTTAYTTYSVDLQGGHDFSVFCVVFLVFLACM